MSKEIAGTPRYANRPGLPPLSPEIKRKMEDRTEAAVQMVREKGAKAAKGLFGNTQILGFLSK
jgi:hypothetical protein